MNDGKIIYPELSYQIIGAAFRVFNIVGYGLREKVYQQSFARELELLKLSFVKECLVEIMYKDEKIGKFFLDFIVENKIVVELKVRSRFGYTDIRQVMDYLKAGGYKLAILIYVTRDGIKYRRILNSI